MILRKTALVLILLFFCTVISFAENVKLVVDVTNVVINNGKVYVAIFFNADEFRREEPTIAFEFESNRTVLTQEVELPPGEYLFSAFQDTNGNGTLDFNFIGIPKELVGISNFDGRGIPTRNFNRHKIPIDASTGRVTVSLHKFF